MQQLTKSLRRNSLGLSEVHIVESQHSNRRTISGHTARIQLEQGGAMETALSQGDYYESGFYVHLF